MKARHEKIIILNSSFRQDKGKRANYVATGIFDYRLNNILLRYANA